MGNSHTGELGITTTPGRDTIQTHFHVQHDTKTTIKVLPAEREASWWLLPSLVSLLLGGKVQPENSYSCILRVTGQV